MSTERVLDLFGLTGPQQTMVNEDAGELVADRLVDQRRGNRRVDTAGKPADDSGRSHLGPNLFDSVLDN